MANSTTSTQLENEIKVIGKLIDCIKYSSFSGHMAQDVAIGMMYLQGLHDHLKKAVADVSAPVADAPVESKQTVSVISETPAIEVVK